MIVLRAAAPAKLNLTLRVGPRRADGFHDVETLMTRVALCDELAIELDGEAGVRVCCSDPAIPSDERNLAHRAATLYLTESGRTDLGMRIVIDKRIPSEAGLGGGSSDAAAVLTLLNGEIRALRTEKLAELAAHLGSDVPFFLGPSAAWYAGRGEQFVEAQRLPECWAVVLLPRARCPTAEVYRAFDALLAPAAERSSVDLNDVRSAAELMHRLYNDLESAAEQVAPEVGRLRREAEALAGGAVRMTGSGSALFRLFGARADAEHFCNAAGTRLPVGGRVALVI